MPHRASLPGALFPSIRIIDKRMKIFRLLLLLASLPLSAESPALPFECSDSNLENELRDAKSQAEAGDRRSTREVYTRYALKGHTPQAKAWAEKYTEQLKREAEAGSGKAMLLLGSGYMTGKDYMAPDPAQAFTWLHRAADAGEASAAYILGQLYCEQGNTSESTAQYKRAYDLYKKGYEAAPEDAEALYWLGYMEQMGLGIPTDAAAGIAKLEKAADLGHSGACTQLFSTYIKGTGVAEDRAKAYFYAAKLADEKQDALMAYALAYAYLEGEGIPQDKTKGEHYLDIAARANLPDAVYAKAKRLMEAGSIREGLPFLQQAASMGQRDAVTELGRRSIFGEGIDKDAAAGLRYLETAANRLDAPQAAFYLGRYYDSIGEPALADTWYVTASNRGIAEAMARRGLLHILFSPAVSWSPTEAYRWWKKGAAAGDETCKRYVNLFLYVFTPLLVVLIFGVPALLAHRLNKKAEKKLEEVRELQP